MDKLERKPLTDEDREEFVRSVIEVARTFGIRSVTLTFSDRGPGQHSAGWAEGRHGAPSHISLSYQTRRDISERPMP
jgi:hypothetical protein